jgi:predicted transcriptional regulator
MPIPTTIYLDDDLRDRVKLIARRNGRKISPQISRWVERIVDRVENKNSNPGARRQSRKGRTACRA